MSSTSGLRGHLLLAFLNEKKPFNQNFHFVNKMSKKKKKKTVSRSLGYVSPIIRSLKMAPPRWEFLMYLVQSRNQNSIVKFMSWICLIISPAEATIWPWTGGCFPPSTIITISVYNFDGIIKKDKPCFLQTISQYLTQVAS